MNICLFTSSFLPKVGGMENVVDILAKECKALGHQVVVLAKTPRKMKTPPHFDYPVYYYKRSRPEIFFLGAPVIGTDIPGIREILQDGFNGKLVPPGDPEALEQVIEAVAQEDHRAYKAHAKEILSAHSWRKIAEQYITIFEKLIQSSIHKNLEKKV